MALDNEYKLLLASIKERVQEAQLKTVVAANSQLLFLYWQLGNFILQNQNKQGWGAKIIDRLSGDLSKEFPELKGFSVRNLKYMRKFAEAYPLVIIQAFSQLESEIKNEGGFTQQSVNKLLSIDNQTNIFVQQPVAQFQKPLTENVQQPVAQTEETLFLGSIIARLSWSHHVILMDKVPKEGQRFWYMLHTLENGISRNILALQIDSRLYERQIATKKTTNFSRTLPAPQTDFANYMLKDPYIFDFVQAKEKADERNIEQQLTEHITKFLLELGQGFAFIGRQVHFEVGSSDFYIDLLFYHTRLHAYVVIELKAREFEPGDAGQINFYINLVNDKLKGPTDNDTIGILLCRGKNEVLAEYALKGIKQPIGVSDYQLSKAIPQELKSQLPDVTDLENELLKEE